MSLGPLVSRVDVANKVLEARRKLGLTQEEFAAALGVPGSQSQVSLWEKGKVAPSVDTLKRISKLAGLRLDDFVDWYDLDDPKRLGNILIEVAERFSTIMPREDALMVLQQLVADLKEACDYSYAEIASWEGYLRGLGVVRRVPEDEDKDTIENEEWDNSSSS